MTTKALFRWHLWLGLATSVFMAIVCASGSIAVFIEEIDWLVTPALRARPDASGTRASADVVLASVRSAYPGDRITTLNLSGRPAFAHVAKVQSRSRGDLDVFIDPASGSVSGDRAYTAAYTSTLRNFIRQLHLRLFMGLWGRVFVGVFGVTLVLSCITGLWIYRGWYKHLFRLRWRSTGQRTRWSDLHKFIGAWSLLFNLLIGATGAVFGLENLTSQIRARWLRPVAAESNPPPAASRRVRAEDAVRGTPGEVLPLETLLARARETFPDLAVRSIAFPAQASGAIVLRGNVPSALVQQSHVRRVNFISLDPRTGAVRQHADGRDAVGWSRVYSSFDPLHFGYFGGITTKVIWFVLGLSPVVLSLTGSWLWWRRTRAARSRPVRPTAVPATSCPAIAPIALAGTLVTLAGAYVLVARAQGNWALTGKLVEHALAKPVALALVAFPVTGVVAWLGWRASKNRWRFAAVTGLAAVWYLSLVTLFQ